MKQLLLLILLMPLGAAAQWLPDANRDHIWIEGDSQSGDEHGGCGFDFNITPVNIFTCNHQLNYLGASSAVCDINGNLLFHTDGKYVADRNGNIMPHGDSLSFGNIYLWYPDGNPIYQSVLALPLPPGTSTTYYVLHTKTDVVRGIFLVTGFYLTIVDMERNNGLGDVIQKNIPILIDTMDMGSLTAVRHGNGRDWWILLPEYHHAAYYRFLLSPKGLELDGKQYIGKASTGMEMGTASFSPDGNLYARSGDSCGGQPVRLDLFSFDRCTGLLSNYHDLGFTNYTKGAGVIFSPDSKVMYFTHAVYIYQYDLTANDIKASQKIVATYDGFPHNYEGFGFGQLTPDNRIFITTDVSKYIHVIENPNVLGPGCNVQQHSIWMPRRFCTPPNYPNYRLGALQGSICDSVYHTGIQANNTEQHITLTAFPNPATDLIRFEVDITQNLHPLDLEIYNLLSQKTGVHEVNPSGGDIRYDISGFPEGVYIAILKRESKVLATAKFVVTR